MRSAFTSRQAGRGRSAEELSGPGLLSEISEQTGGRHFPVENLNDLPDVAAKDRDRAAESVFDRIHSIQRGARRQIPARQGEISAAARITSAACDLEIGILCAYAVDAALVAAFFIIGSSSPRAFAQDDVPHFGRYPAGDSSGHGAGQERPPDHQSHRRPFQVFENNAPQPLKLFKREDVPVSLGMIIDSSGSMRDKRASVEAAALTLVKESNQEDEVFIVNFNDEAFLDQPIYQRHQEDGTGSFEDRFPRGHRHARRHPHVHRP